MTNDPEHNLAEDYRAKDASYFSNARVDYIGLLPADPEASILELGCGNGATGALALAEGKCGRYVGIELFEPMARQARDVLTEVHVGDVEKMSLPYAPGTFDALILSEVMEHLVDPYTTLAKLTDLLKPGALVFASSPNIGHWRNVVGLALGRFEYTDVGMMDRTHLRWYTPDSFARMFEDAGVTVERLAPFNSRSWKQRLFAKVFKPMASMTYFQINLHGRYASVPPAASR